MPAAHRRVEHLDVETGVGKLLHLGAIPKLFGVFALFLRQFFCLAIALLGVAQQRRQHRKLALQHRANRVLHNVLHNIVGRVVTAGGFALALVVLQIDVALVQRRHRAPVLDFGKGRVEFLAVLLHHRQLLGGDAQLELQQPLVDAAQMPHAQRLEVDKNQRVRLLVHIATEPIQPLRQEAIGDGVARQQPPRRRLRRKQPAVIRRQIERRVAGVDGFEQLLQPGVQPYIARCIRLRQFLGGVLLHLTACRSDLRFDLAQTHRAVTVRLGQRQQLHTLGIGHKHQPIQKGQRRLKHLLQIDLAAAPTHISGVSFPNLQSPISQSIFFRPHLHNQPLGKARENFLEDPILQTLAQRRRVLLRFTAHLVQKASERCGAKEEPPILDRRHPVFRRKRLLQIDLVVICRLVVSLCGIEPPQLAIRRDHPGRLPGFQRRDDERAGNLVAGFLVTRRVDVVEIAIPHIGQRRRQRLAAVAGRIEEIVRRGSVRIAGLVLHKVEAQEPEDRLV